MPEGWEWLDELAGEWHPPEELHGPSNSTQINLAIRILSCDAVTLEIRSLAGRFISESADFTRWYAEEVKASDRDISEAAHLSQLPKRQAALVYGTWKEFCGAMESEGSSDEVGRRVSASRSSLADALRRAVEALAAARREEGTR